MATNKGSGAGDGNGWGPNISRLVRTSSGDIYTTVVEDGPDLFHRNWRLYKRSEATGQWTLEPTEGTSGANILNPPSILRGPNDEIYVVSWPNMQPYLWSSAAKQDVRIPGEWFINPHVPSGRQESAYGAASIDTKGSIYVSQSSIGCTGCDHENKPGLMYVADRAAGGTAWRSSKFQTEFRHTYNFLLPVERGLLIVASLDARYSELGYKVPEGSRLNYAFDGVRQWHLENVTSKPSEPLLVHQEVPDAACPNVRTFASDAYLDTKGRTHIIYDQQGPTTNCIYTGRHAIIEEGRIVKDIPLAPAASLTEGVPYSNFARIIQDAGGRFYIFSASTPPEGGKSCVLYMQRGTEDDTDGTKLEPQVQLPVSTTADCSTMQNHFIAAPRGGTALANVVDGMIAAGHGSQWLYYRLCLRECGSAPAAGPASAATPSPATTPQSTPSAAETPAPAVLTPTPSPAPTRAPSTPTPPPTPTPQATWTPTLSPSERVTATVFALTVTSR
jgi:hypothetical protein